LTAVNDPAISDEERDKRKKAAEAKLKDIKDTEDAIVRFERSAQTILAEQIAPQQALRAEAVALGRDLTALRDRSQTLSDRARGPAQEAAQTIGEQAPRAMDQGSDRLAQGQAGAARDAQRQAAALIERGAQQAEDLAAALRADRRPETPRTGADAADTPQQPLAAARAAMRQAAEQLAQSQEQAARQAMQQAARDLRAAAQRGTSTGEAGAAAAADASLAAQGAPGESDSGDPGATLARPGTPDLSELKAAIARKTGRAWGELPGHLRTEILQMSQGRYRDDYARLIQLYFREIAAGADAGSRP